MKTLTVKIPEALEDKLRRRAKSDHESVSVVVRRALLRELEADATDFVSLATPFVGMFAGAADHSTGEGYGSRDSS